MTTTYHPYNHQNPVAIADRAEQIRHLALISLAACGSEYNVRDLPRAYVSLFEVIARLARDIEEEAEE